MTSRDELERLRDAVQAGTLGDTGVDRFTAIPARGGGVYSDPNWYAAGSAYWRGSLDAAKDLHDALLPGWDWEVSSQNAAAVFKGPLISGPSFLAASETASRAWLIAILDAMIAQEGQE